MLQQANTVHDTTPGDVLIGSAITISLRDRNLLWGLLWRGLRERDGEHTVLHRRLNLFGLQIARQHLLQLS